MPAAKSASLSRRTHGRMIRFLWRADVLEEWVDFLKGVQVTLKAVLPDWLDLPESMQIENGQQPVYACRVQIGPEQAIQTGDQANGEDG